MLGVVNLDKPVGPTSHDMVALVRRLAGERRVGHAGTLDPLASGALPILVGAATRLSEELSAAPKRYAATIRLGARSETDDAQGPITPVAAPLPEPSAIEAALDAFRGTFEQRPPAFSARKVAGRVAYHAARAGKPLDLPPRRVSVESLDMVAVRSVAGGIEVDVDIRCGSGTYIRAIARDLGERLGCGGYLAALRRTEAAGLRVEDGISPDALRNLATAGRLAAALIPIEAVLSLERVDLDAVDGRRFASGLPVVVRTPGEGRRGVFADGELLGVGELRDAILRPVKVLAAPAASR